MVARRQALASRNRSRLRLCRSKPFHQGLHAPAWYQPGRLAATAGNCSEVVNGSGRAAAGPDLLLDLFRTDNGRLLFTRTRTSRPVAFGEFRMSVGGTTRSVSLTSVGIILRRQHARLTARR